jgi:hypothetical protein
MKVDIWITTDEGTEYHGENMSWSEACAEICNQHILEELCRILGSEATKDYIKDVANESNKN